MPSGYVSLSRARRALRLVCELREIGVGTEEGRQHLAAGIAHEIGAVVGGVVQDRGFGLGLKFGVTNVTLFGVDSQILPVFEAHHVHGSAINPVHRKMMHRSRESPPVDRMTYAEHVLLTRREWDAERWVADYVRPSHLDHFVGSGRILGPNAGEGVGFMRAKRDRPFSQEDCDVLDLIIGECGPLFAVNDHRPTGARDRKLAPRVRATLERLLTGATDKEIALQLGLSPHTVRDYLKTLYRTYGVTSRGQLIALVLGEETRSSVNRADRTDP